MIIIENDNNNNDNSNNDDNDNTSDNDENNDNDDIDNDDKLPVDFPHKWPIMLSFDVTFVESKNNSLVSSDLRRNVPNVTSLWCDIFIMPHCHICIVKSRYEYISSYMSICIKKCVRCNWLWCFGNTAIQSTVVSPHKWPVILRLDAFFVVSWANFWNNSDVLFGICFH